MKFVHLHTHSFFSLLDGVPAPEELVQMAQYHKMPALALTDHNGLYGAVRFYSSAKAAGIKPIIGAELTLNDFGNLVCLVRNREGYEHLSELITRGHLRGGHGKFSLTLKDVLSLKKGLYILIGGRKNKIFHYIQNRKTDLAFDLIRQLVSLFGSQLYLELQQLHPSDVVLNRRYIDFAQTLQIQTVATNNVHFLKSEDWKVYQILRAIHQNQPLSAVKELLPAECYFRSMGEMIDLFSYYPEALQNTLHIAERCKFDFQLGKPVFPQLHREQNKTSFQILAEKVKEGLEKRYGTPVPEKIKKRARKELRVIRQLGFPDYFLIVEDIVSFCRKQNIPCVGRGSAGDSLVAYALEITHVDPVRYNLYFERFLNTGRKEPPDIDLDICWKNRDRVLEYVYHRFGHDKTAMICTFHTFKLRSSVRDIAKVFGIPEDEIRLLTNYLPHYSKYGLRKTLETLPEFQHLRHQFFIYEEIFELSEKIKDLPRHLSVHPGGIIIAPDKITRFLPLEEAGKGLIISQYDMVDVEKLGLVKMDLLGVRSLSIIAEVIETVSNLRRLGHIPVKEMEKEQKQNIQPDLFQDDYKVIPGLRKQTYVYELNPHNGKIEKRKRKQYLSHNKFCFLQEQRDQYSILDLKMIPEDDREVIQMLKNGYSIGCFQLESPGMRGLLRKLQMDSMDDVIISVALIRPGAANSGMKDTFIRRRAGLEPVRYLHPILEPLLKETLGVVIYQEQVMQIAHHVAGISLKDADYLRRAMTKHRDKKEIFQLRKQFIAGVRKKGLSLANASRLWNFLLNFTGYGFNKAHAATYGVLAYQSAYLKKYFPVIFMTAVLNNEGGFYSRMAYMEEARRMGIKLLPPDVHHSEASFTCFEDQIRVGLLAVHELSVHTTKRIIRERQRKPFSSLQDFLQRVKPAVNEAINLAKCGALRSMVPSESQAVLLIKLYYQNKRQWTKVALTANDIRLRPYNLFQRVFHEMELLNCAVSAHPLVLFRDKIPDSCIPSYQLGQCKGQKVDFCGWGVTSRTAQTAKGKVVKFLTLEDFFGIVEVVCWEDVYKKYSHLLKGHGPFVITGVVQARVKGELHMVAEKIQKIELTKKEWEQILANGTSDEKKSVLQSEQCRTDSEDDQKE